MSTPMSNEAATWPDPTLNFPSEHGYKIFNAGELPLLDYLDHIDPTHRLGDPEFRADLLGGAQPFPTAMAVREVQQRVIDQHGLDIYPYPCMLGVDENIAYVGVSPEHRALVFEYALVAAGAKAEMSDLETAAQILAGTIVAMQMFRNANKRTARAMYLLVSHGYDGSGADRALYEAQVYPDKASATGVLSFRPQADWNRQAFLESNYANGLEIEGLLEQTEGWRQGKPSVLELVGMQPQELSPQSSLSLANVIQENVFGPFLLAELFETDITELGDEDRVHLGRLSTLVRKLTPEQALGLIDRSERLKVEFIKFLIDRTVLLSEPGSQHDPYSAHINIVGGRVQQPVLP